LYSLAFSSSHYMSPNSVPGTLLLDILFLGLCPLFALLSFFPCFIFPHFFFYATKPLKTQQFSIWIKSGGKRMPGQSWREQSKEGKTGNVMEKEMRFG
ncbi:MAG: hypothetical protein WCJ84_06745, partial [Candidatus Peregrinibacteria bacterium]